MMRVGVKIRGAVMVGVKALCKSTGDLTGKSGMNICCEFQVRGFNERETRFLEERINCR